MDVEYKETIPLYLEKNALENLNDEENYYQKNFSDLYSDDQTIVTQAILNLAKLADKDITLFFDCAAFTKIHNIANNPLFENYIPILHFFDSITSKVDYNMKLIAKFISPSFLLTLKNFLFFNFENPDLYRILFHIYGNIIYSSEFFSSHIINSEFLSRVYEIVHKLPKTSDYFLELLGCILLRYKILMNFDNDPFPKIHRIINFFFSSSDFILFSNVFSTLSQVSSISCPSFVKSFFVPFIIQKLYLTLQFEFESQCDSDRMAQYGIYYIKKSSLYSLKRDALIIFSNFSSIDDETRNLLIETGLLDLNVTNLCFTKQESCDPFKKSNPVLNGLDSSIIPDIASNFFTSSHSIAIQFAYSILWETLIKNYEWFNFETKQKIARAASLAISSFKDEDLVTRILCAEMLPFVIDSLNECFSNNSLDLELNFIEAIENLISMFEGKFTIAEINMTFTAMMESGIVDQIEEFSHNGEKMTKPLFYRIQKILSFFNEYSRDSVGKNQKDGF